MLLSFSRLRVLKEGGGDRYSTPSNAGTSLMGEDPGGCDILQIGTGLSRMSEANTVPVAYADLLLELALLETSGVAWNTSSRCSRGQCSMRRSSITPRSS